MTSETKAVAGNSGARTRAVVFTTQGVAASDGAGVKLQRLIHTPELDMADPFLMLDAFGSDRPGDYLAGFPDHPHRGFETVTYLLAGRLRHKDSTGREGVIESGGVQWMTAGRGIIHSEMPEQEDGLLAGFQLWVNLPAKDKMCAPRYQEHQASALAIEDRPGARLTVIAGTTSRGTTGPVHDVAVTPLYVDAEIGPGQTLEEPIDSGMTVFFYVIEGDVKVTGKVVPARTLAVLGRGDLIALTAGSAGARVLLVAGQPIGEPVARYGPFVMNSVEELRQAFEDFQSGRF